MEENKEKKVPEKSKEIDLDDLDNVSGGVNPFAKYSRVENQKIDENIKGKV